MPPNTHKYSVFNATPMKKTKYQSMVNLHYNHFILDSNSIPPNINMVIMHDLVL